MEHKLTSWIATTHAFKQTYPYVAHGSPANPLTNKISAKFDKCKGLPDVIRRFYCTGRFVAGPFVAGPFVAGRYVFGRFVDQTFRGPDVSCPDITRYVPGHFVAGRFVAGGFWVYPFKH